MLAERLESPTAPDVDHANSAAARSAVPAASGASGATTELQFLTSAQQLAIYPDTSACA